MEANSAWPHGTLSTNAPNPNWMPNAPSTVLHEIALRFLENPYAMPRSTAMPTKLINMLAS